MFAGTFVHEDHVINFKDETKPGIEPNTITYTVIDTLKQKMVTMTVPSNAFMLAMSIAFHPDGDARVSDYKEAETAMPEDKDLRWIP